MPQDVLKTIWLRRRYGFSIFPLVIVNSIILYALSIRENKFGVGSAGNFFIDAFGAILLLNIIPILLLFDIWLYRLGWSDNAIYVRPLISPGPYLTMRFDEVDVVDLKPLSDLRKSNKARINPSVIVLYRKGWDGEEIFALDPRRTNLRQFKNLVRMIHDRCPGTFSEDALRYLNSPNLITPCENPEGQFVW